MPTDVDPPDRVKWSDDILDWIANYRRRWEKKLAATEAERLNTEWLCKYVATRALCMENAGHADRRAAVADILSIMRDAGLWEPLQAPETTSAGS